ncbi:MAG: acetyl-CoA carboxylase biotin carboxyl carrier protein [Cellulosilyticaceae bacterium]
MKIDLIKELIGEFKDSDLTRLKLNLEGFELELEREKEITFASTSMPVTPQVVANMPSTTTEVNINTESKKTSGHELAAPLVGTFYLSSAPGKDPFVRIGSKVKKGDVVCIIEAMKLMNEVEADADGTIVEILAENETMVEFGQPLFIIQ